MSATEVYVMEGDLTNQKYINFFKIVLGLRELQKGLHPFITKVLEAIHKSLIARVRGSGCTSCTLDTLQLDHTKCKNKGCICKRPVAGRRPCPVSTCHKLYDEVALLSLTGKPYFQNKVIYQVYTDPWKLGKCFLPIGYGEKTSASECDATGLLNIVIFCKEMATILGATISRTSPKDIFTEVKDIRNECMHSVTLEVSEYTMKSALSRMIDILRHCPDFQSDSDAKDAAKSIQKLMDDKMIITTQMARSVLEEKFTAVEEKLNSLRCDTSKHDKEILELQNVLETFKTKMDDLTKITEQHGLKLDNHDSILNNLNKAVFGDDTRGDRNATVNCNSLLPSHHKLNDDVRHIGMKDVSGDVQDGKDLPFRYKKISAAKAVCADATVSFRGTVLEVGPFEEYNNADMPRKFFRLKVADETDFVQIKCYQYRQHHIIEKDRSYAFDNIVKNDDESDKLVCTSKSKITISMVLIPVPDNIREQADDQPNLQPNALRTLAMARRSATTSTVCGKVVQSSPVKQLADDLKLKVLRMKDSSDGPTVKVPVFQDDAERDYAKGDVVRISHVYRHQVHGLSTKKTAKVEFLSPDSLNFEVDDSQNLADSIYNETSQFTVVGVTAASVYTSCAKSRCRNRKMNQDGRCPSCNGTESALYARAVLTVSHDNTLTNHTLFSPELQKLVDLPNLSDIDGEEQFMRYLATFLPINGQGHFDGEKLIITSVKRKNETKWLLTVQIMMTLVLSNNVVTSTLCVAGRFNYLLPYHEARSQLILSGMMFLSGFLLSFSVTMFGIQSDVDRQWIPRPDQNYLSWSFGLVVVAGFFVIFAAMCFLFDGLRINYNEEKQKRAGDPYKQYKKGIAVPQY